jgi:hypothetical protein
MVSFSWAGHDKERRYEKMAGTKYGKYVIKAPIIEGRAWKGFGARSGGEWHLDDESKFTGGADCLISLSWVTEPVVMEGGKPHAHDFDQFLGFYGGIPSDIKDFGAEIEMCLGEEGEKHTFTDATIIYIPKGLAHAPLTIKKLKRPILMLNVVLASKYAQIKKE